MSETPTAVPNPGSLAAYMLGCDCPVMDNRRGLGVPSEGGLLFWIAAGCPVHDPALATSATKGGARVSARPCAAGCGREIVRVRTTGRLPIYCPPCGAAKKREQNIAHGRALRAREVTKPTGIDYTERAERELGLDYHTGGADARRRIVEHAWALIEADRAAGTFIDVHAGQRESQQRAREKYEATRRGRRGAWQGAA